MPHTLRSASRLFAVVAVMLAAVGAVSAQDDDEDDDAAPMNAQVQAQMKMMHQFMANDQSFEVGAFGNLRTAIAAREQLEKLLTIQTDDVDRACGLTGAQKKKL